MLKFGLGLGVRVVVLPVEGIISKMSSHTLNLESSHCRQARPAFRLVWPVLIQAHSADQCVSDQGCSGH